MSELLTRMKIATMALAALLLAGCGRQAGPPSTVGGTVKDSSGRPAAGALVRVSSAQPGRVVLVVSQTDGSFRTPKLTIGVYTAQAFLGD